MAPASLSIEHAGCTLVLLAQRALWWPQQRTLLVADVHIGKAAAFGALGVPVPGAADAGTLGRLGALLRDTGAARLAILGDLLHAPAAQAPAVVAQLSAWRERHATTEMVLVRGNHDARAGDPPAALRIDVVDEPWAVGPFLLCHEPRARAGGYVLAGHLHPAVALAGRADRLRLPCFWFGREVGVLPAFGEFTGSLTVRPAAGERVFALAGEQVFELPSRRA